MQVRETPRASALVSADNLIAGRCYRLVQYGPYPPSEVDIGDVGIAASSTPFLPGGRLGNCHFTKGVAIFRTGSFVTKCLPGTLWEEVPNAHVSIA